MSQKLEALKDLLNREGLWAKKSLGQNFLVDEKALQTIIEAADLQPKDVIIEVGPGTGLLTEKLIEKAKQVTAVEYDADMVNLIEKRFKNNKNLQIIHSDILKFNIGNWKLEIGNCDYKVIANIPYYITSPLLKHFLQAKHPPTSMVILVQKEVAEKIAGITAKSLITIETQLYGKPTLVDYVKAKSFYPAPKVDSAILKIDLFDQPLIEADQVKDFLRIVKFGFSQKRKKLSNTLSAGLRLSTDEIKKRLNEAGVDHNLRAEHLEIEHWKSITEVFSQMMY